MKKNYLVLLLIVVMALSACQQTPAATPPVPDAVVPRATPMPTVAVTEAPTGTPDPFYSGEGDFKSGDGSEEVTLKFINNTDETLLINWIDYDGVEQPFSQVGPEASIPVTSYATHAWRVKDQSGNVYAEIIATSEKMQVYEFNGLDSQVVYQPTPLAAPTFGPGVPVTEHAYADRPDDNPDLYQFHILYVIPAGAKDRQIDLDGTISRTVETSSQWFSEQSGGSTLRFDTYQGQLDITFVELEMTNQEFIGNTTKTYGSNVFTRDYLEQTLDKMRILHPGKIYIACFDISAAPNACADASHFPDLPGRLAGLYAIADSSGYACANDAYGVENLDADLTLPHEALHSLGFASACGKNPASAENLSHTGDDGRDLMWGPASYDPGFVSELNWDPYHMQLDPGNDDYFQHDIAGCPDLADSAFLDPLPANAELPKGWPAEWELH